MDRGREATGRTPAMQIKIGARYRSQVCDTESIVVRACPAVLR
jgi:hypothetical protein